MLFGHQNDDNQPNDGQNPAAGTNPLAVDPDTGVSLPVAPEDLEHNGDHPDASVLDQPHHDDTPADPGASLSPDDDGVASQPSSGAPASFYPSDNSGTSAASTNDDSTQPASDDDLLNLKQQALHQLSPLVDHLDQTPEEKFRTTMMMIQSSDNQSLIKDAYAAAQAIHDDKARAQALLDIVNEINYFTQK